MHRTFLIAGVIVLLYIGGIVAYLRDTSPEVYDMQLSDSVPDDHLEFDVTTVGIDVAKQQVTVSINPVPQGKLTDDQGWSATKDVSFIIYTPDSEKTVQIKKGEPITAMDVVIPAYGNIAVYPFDAYSGWIAFDSDDPYVVHWESSVQAFHAQVSKSKDSKESLLSLDLNLTRSASIRAFGVFLYLLTALVACVALAVMTRVAYKGYKLEFGQITWTGALLFVLPAVRSSLPGSPPVGTLGDFLIFFWAEALVVFSLLVLVERWISTMKPAEEKPAE